MTLPVAGYPDYQQYPSWRGVVLFDGPVGLNANTGTTVGTWAAHNFACIRLNISGNERGQRVTLLGQNDAVGTGQFIMNQWEVRPQTFIQVIVPITASYISVTCIGDTAGHSTVRLSLQPTNLSPNRTIYVGGASTTQLSSHVIIPGANETWYPNLLMPGTAHLWIFGLVNPLPLDINVLAYDYLDNSTVEISTWRTVAVDFHAIFILPELSWRIKFTNNSGVNQTYWFTVATAGTTA